MVNIKMIEQMQKVFYNTLKKTIQANDIFDEKIGVYTSLPENILYPYIHINDIEFNKVESLNNLYKFTCLIGAYMESHKRKLCTDVLDLILSTISNNMLVDEMNKVNIFSHGIKTDVIKIQQNSNDTILGQVKVFSYIEI